MNRAEQSILKILAYYNLFIYPLKKEELISFLDAAYTEVVIDNALENLKQTGIIYYIQPFYLLQNDPRLIERRLKGNARANEQLRLANKIARFLGQFPYVKGVAVSGSLSKIFADDHSDIDFFIITAKNRLWIARTLMHLFKKLSFFAGKQHLFCMNYYIDEEGLTIKEKNVFTAMEIVTLLPLCDDSIFRNFFQSNRWAANYFPLCNPATELAVMKKGFVKRASEKMLSIFAGNKVDDFLMKLTLKRWHRKTIQMKRNYHGGLMGMDGSKHYAKPAPAHFQEKIIRMHREASESLIKQFMIRDQAMGDASFFRKEIM